MKDVSDAARGPLAIRITRPYFDEDEFLANEADTITPTGVVLLGAQTRPEGTILRFELALRSGDIVLRGEGRVTGYKAKARGETPGLVLRFTRLDLRSKSFLDRLAALRESRPRAPQPSQVSAEERRPSSPPPLPPLSSPGPVSSAAPASTAAPLSTGEPVSMSAPGSTGEVGAAGGPSSSPAPRPSAMPPRPSAVPPALRPSQAPPPVRPSTPPGFGAAAKPSSPPPVPPSLRPPPLPSLRPAAASVRPPPLPSAVTAAAVVATALAAESMHTADVEATYVETRRVDVLAESGPVSGAHAIVAPGDDAVPTDTVADARVSEVSGSVPVAVRPPEPSSAGPESAASSLAPPSSGDVVRAAALEPGTRDALLERLRARARRLGPDALRTLRESRG